jgi:hypothetical protein
MPVALAWRRSLGCRGEQYLRPVRWEIEAEKHRELANSEDPWQPSGLDRRITSGPVFGRSAIGTGLTLAESPLNLGTPDVPDSQGIS